jgi:hypothetical protein
MKFVYGDYFALLYRQQRLPLCLYESVVSLSVIEVYFESFGVLYETKKGCFILLDMSSCYWYTALKHFSLKQVPGQSAHISNVIEQLLEIIRSK